MNQHQPAIDRTPTCSLCAYVYWDMNFRIAVAATMLATRKVGISSKEGIDINSVIEFAMELVDEFHGHGHNMSTITDKIRNMLPEERG